MDLKKDTKPERPLVGIMMLDTVFPRIKGDIGNPDTFDFPVRFKKITGASARRIVLEPDIKLIQPFIDAGRELIRDGAAILTTSCGFLALFHNALNESLSVPVYSSSLLQVHLAQSIIKKEQKIGIITAHKPALSQDHLAAIGIEKANLEIIGMEDAREFSSVFIGGKKSLDADKCGQEMQETTLDLMKSHPDIGAIVLECTNMPPYSGIVRKAAGVPVFDTITMLNCAYATISDH